MGGIAKTGIFKIIGAPAYWSFFRKTKRRSATVSEASSFSVGQFKSPLRVLCSWFYRSRERLRERFKELGLQKKEIEQAYQGVVQENRSLTKRLQQAKAELAQHQRQIAKQQAEPARLADDPNLAGHQFGPRMIALCLGMAKLIGFRSTERVLPLISEWLQVEFDVPNHDTIRLWASRNGVAILQESAQVGPIGFGLSTIAFSWEKCAFWSCWESASRNCQKDDLCDERI